MNASPDDERDRNRYTGYQEAWDAETTADSGPQRWLDAEGNTDWDAHAHHADELRDAELKAVPCTCSAPDYQDENCWTHGRHAQS